MTQGRLFEGKRVLVFGVANERSIAWAIAEAMHRTARA
jgi:enoyl-[acyl-carrier-protein] reductase (NADH)